MRRAVLVCLFTALFVIGIVGSLRLSNGEANTQKNTIEIAQGNRIMWNNTDYNSTYTPASYPGSEMLYRRILVEYADLASKYDMALGLSNFTLSPRIMIEYADYTSFKNAQLQHYQGPDIVIPEFATLSIVFLFLMTMLLALFIDARKGRTRRSMYCSQI